MSNFNCTNSNLNSGLNVANQLRFLTLSKNGSIQNIPQNTNTAGIPAAQTPAANKASGQFAPQYQNVLLSDTVDFSDKYAADDGKISAKDKAVNFGKGMITPVTAMFSSPKNFVIGAAGIIGGGLLIAATGGAAAPVMVAAGVTGGAIGLVKSGLSAMNAKTDDEARKAWQGLGLSTTVAAGSIAGSKAALKGAGIDTSGLNPFSATVKCFKTMPAQVGKSISAFTSGEAILNIKNALHIKNKDSKKTDDKTGAKDTPDSPADKTKNTTGENKTDSIKTEAKENKPVVIEEGNGSIEGAEISAGENIEGTIKGEGKDGIEGASAADKPKKTKQAPKTKRRRQSRIKHKVPKKQAEQVKQEVKTIGQILDDIVENNDVDTQFRQTVENLKEIAQNPLEQPKYDEKSLISAIKHLEGHSGDKPNSLFDEAISYIENLLSKEYKIDRLQAKTGDAFDSTIMSALESEPTNNSQLNNTVFKMLFSGFRKQEGGKVPSGWKIKVVKYTKE